MKKIDLTANRLFFELLHHARRLKNDLLWSREARQLYLNGMTCVFILQHDDFRQADKMRDFWKAQNSWDV